MRLPPRLWTQSLSNRTYIGYLKSEFFHHSNEPLVCLLTLSFFSFSPFSWWNKCIFWLQQRLQRNGSHFDYCVLCRSRFNALSNRHLSELAQFIRCVFSTDFDSVFFRWRYKYFYSFIWWNSWSSIGFQLRCWLWTNLFIHDSCIYRSIRNKEEINPSS